MSGAPQPRRIVFVTEYPTTATGKVRRVELRARATEILPKVPL
jgi:acyl-coenzyme A synthetase/AMP-(fatty) acid ligase